MEFFIDSADIEAIRELAAFLPIDGVTTNPTILTKSGKDPEQVFAELCEVLTEDQLQIVSEREGGVPAVLVVTTFDMDADVFGALEAGADGFILKDCEPEELVDAVRRLASGYGLVDQSVTRRVIAEFARRQGRVENREALGVLTEREREVVQLLAGGMSNAEIAAELIVETSTVKSHLTRILPKIGARDRVQAVVWAFRNGLV